MDLKGARDDAKVDFPVLASLLVASIAAGCLFSAPSQDNGGTNRTDQASSKPIYYYFYSDTCPACTLMEQTTLSNLTVIEVLNLNFTYRKVNVAYDEGLVRKYGVVFVPTSIFARPDGTEISRMVGAISPGEFLQLLDQVLATGKGE